MHRDLEAYKIERSLFELDYEVTDVTNQMFIDFFIINFNKH